MAEAQLNVKVGAEVELEPGPLTVAWLMGLGWTPPEQSEQDAMTTRVFAGLHQSAESDVSRVIALYEQWVAQGAPPLGVSMARWWDKKLVELHDAIRPPESADDEEDYDPRPVDLIPGSDIPLPPAQELATGGVYRGEAMGGAEAMRHRARQLRTRLRGELADEGAQRDLDELLRMCDVDMKRIFGTDCDC